MPAALIEKYQYFTQARMERLRAAGYSRRSPRWRTASATTSALSGDGDPYRSEMTRLHSQFCSRLRVSRGLALCAIGFAAAGTAAGGGWLVRATSTAPLDLEASTRAGLPHQWAHGKYAVPDAPDPAPAQLLPQAEIDLALAYRAQPELLGDMPGVRRIIVFPHKTDRMARRFLGALHRLRARATIWRSIRYRNPTAAAWS